MKFEEAFSLMEKGHKVKMVNWHYPQDAFLKLEPIPCCSDPEKKGFYIYHKIHTARYSRQHVEMFILTYEAMKAEWELVK